MPRSSRGSTSHRGHRTRGRHNEPAQDTTAVAAPQEATAEGSADDENTGDQPEIAPVPRVATQAPQPAAATVSGTTMRGDPLLTKELIRISALAVVVLALLVTFTTLVQ